MEIAGDDEHWSVRVVIADNILGHSSVTHVPIFPCWIVEEHELRQRPLIMEPSEEGEMSGGNAAVSTFRNLWKIQSAGLEVLINHGAKLCWPFQCEAADSETLHEGVEGRGIF